MNDRDLAAALTAARAAADAADAAVSAADAADAAAAAACTSALALAVAYGAAADAAYANQNAGRGMTCEDIIKLAREAGCDEASHPMNPWSITQEALERFANLVAAAEREACREIAFRMAHSDEDAVDVSHAIRARGET